MDVDANLGVRPLCVDLDGTLLRTDLLFESLLLLAVKNPFYLLLLPIWLVGGKARLKHEVASRVQLDPSTLPYDERVLAILRQTNARPRVLCTASDLRLAERVAAHLGLFEKVLSSDGKLNLAGSTKGDALVTLFGERGFDYMGNHPVDLQVWQHAASAWVVNGDKKLARQAAGKCAVAGELPKEAGSGFKRWVKAIRVHQWLKNLLIFLPLLAAHKLFDLNAVFTCIVAFVSFGLCASGVYVLNDLLDLSSDRRHPRKRNRPFASGALELKHGLLAAPILTLLGFALAAWVGIQFLAVLAIYYTLTLAYSFRLKRVVMVDVILLATLYTIRIVAGAAAISNPLSFWLLAFSMFVFLSLAMLKRYTELEGMLAVGQTSASGRAYTVEDLALIQSLGAASGYIAVLVLAFYINSPESLALYGRPKVLWLICPVLLYWMSRVWIVAHRGEMDDDPVVFAVKDSVSRIVILICGLLALLAI